MVARLQSGKGAGKSPPKFHPRSGPYQLPEEEVHKRVAIPEIISPLRILGESAQLHKPHCSAQTPHNLLKNMIIR
ncbi:hypothetical protein P879_10376 [Paragonimus westermani]|uniref:Uncharacterized protein n=1 Tax=Paragonimus westermani TaxID=34504 RepID=A0A8T0D8Y9_9TREM|nr:hypothetical protein P879_10376 [Paragonimus westermani]